ncbi:MAG TPA: hypothetical protein PL009_13240 [Flavipsychrobacter sp.]|nr:hypothetical protein [Flavipsychrobacter sp.]
MKRFKLLTFIIAFCSISFYACQHKTNTPAPAGGGGGTGGGGNPPDTGLCFERDILPIFISNCAKSGCHDAASHQEGYVFDSWANITRKNFKPGDPDDTELYEKITEDDHDKIMPPPPNAPLTAKQIGLIREWIKRGAPNTTNCNTGCDSTQFAYSTTIKPLLDNNCKGCHNNTLASGGHSFENYNSTIAVANSGRFLGAIKHLSGYSSMPKGGVKLSDCQVLKIEKWIAAGKLNN